MAKKNGNNLPAGGMEDEAQLLAAWEERGGSPYPTSRRAAVPAGGDRTGSASRGKQSCDGRRNDQDRRTPMRVILARLRLSERVLRR